MAEKGIDTLSDKIANLTDIDKVLNMARTFFYNYKDIFFIVILIIIVILLIWLFFHIKRRDYFNDVKYLFSLVVLGKYSYSDISYVKYVVDKTMKIISFIKRIGNFLFKFKIIRILYNSIENILSYIFFFFEKILTKIFDKIDRIVTRIKNKFKTSKVGELWYRMKENWRNRR